MEFILHVANRNILVHSFYPGIYNMCRPYWAEENAAPDIEIHINEDMIRKEIERIKQEDGQSFDTKSAEKLLVHRIISEELLTFDTLLMHGAVIALDGAAYMFTAKSGTGKTTHIQNWLENAEGAYVVNGDKPFIICEADKSPLACGSPWAGKENLQTNTSVPLKAIVFLERASENRMERISSARAFPLLFEQIYHPNSREKMQKTISLIQRLSKSVSFWYFQCNNFRDDCFDTAYNGLVQKTNECSNRKA